MQSADNISCNGSAITSLSGDSGFGSTVSGLNKENQHQLFGRKSTTSKPTPSRHLTFQEKAEIDARSVYVGGVEYAATKELLEEHFRGCGAVNRVSIMRDQYTGHPKGYAYIEFDEVNGASNAVHLTDTLFLGRQIKVSLKRTNKPGISTTDRAPRGRGKPRIGARRGGFGGAPATAFQHAHGGFNRGRGGFRGMARGRR
uniref:RRM domain-containing protein n=1 Tax=Panagrellus redivivus TaxID=6233 RepID=A0A7E4UZ27_PANRE